MFTVVTARGNVAFQTCPACKEGRHEVCRRTYRPKHEDSGYAEVWCACEDHRHREAPCS